jgi:hypothetical protein
MSGILNYFGIDPISAIISGISAINSIRLDNNEEKALFEEILEEMKDNLKIIKDDYIKNDCSIESVISALKINNLEKGERARKRRKLNFNRIKDGKIKTECFVSTHQKKYYSEFDTEQLLLKIREKIKDIKKVKSLYFKRNQWSHKINHKTRMKTIVELHLLLSKHLSGK